MKRAFFVVALLTGGVIGRAQDTAGTRTLTMDDYARTPGFFIKDLDKDTYVKFDNTYILDKSEFPKPYFITGDDAKKKRIDLYKLILKDGRVDLGIMVFYTTENGKRYLACMPSYKADAKIWEKYFEDIHSIEKEEPFFVLKLSYVLSKELGFQLYKAQSGMQGKEITREAGTYGNDICFPGDMRVRMADGSSRVLSGVRPGDEVVTVDPVTLVPGRVKVQELTVHEEKNYAITKVLLLSAVDGDGEISLHTQWLEATPNHPMVTRLGDKKAGQLEEGDKVVCLDQKTGRYAEFTVWDKTEFAGGMQRVYNIVASGGSTFIMNNVMVLQKPLKEPK
jgi:hypothetical protein